MTARTITAEIGAWLMPTESLSILKEEPARIVDALSYCNNDMKSCGWTYVGKATISVEIAGEDELVANKVQSIRQQITEVRIETESKVARLEDELKKLLALTYDKPSGIVKREQQP